MSSFVHPTAEVAAEATIGADTKIWALSQIREEARIGQNCNVGRNVFIDHAVVVGNNCKIQNNALLYEGVTLEDGVFIGPAVCFTNDKHPRAINPDGTLKRAEDWVISPTLVRYGAAIGAHSVIVTGVSLGRFCLVGSGSVVTKDVPDYGLVVGNPARLVGYACVCANRLTVLDDSAGRYQCPACGAEYQLQNGLMTASTYSGSHNY